MKYGIYSEHDFRFPVYDPDGNRHEGCRWCGQARILIEREHAPCVRPIVSPAGELVELKIDVPAGPLRIDRESIDRLRMAIESLYTVAK